MAKKRTFEIPLHFIEMDISNYHIYINCKINKKKAVMLIDTGASRTVFDTNRIKLFQPNINFEPIEDQHSAGIGSNKVICNLIKLNTFQIGGIILENFDTTAIDMTHVNETYKLINQKEIDGVIGGDILYTLNAIISYKTKKLKLTLPKYHFKNLVKNKD